MNLVKQSKESVMKFYKNCEDYEGSDINTCELITPFKSMYELDDENECVFENNKCVK